MRRCKLISPTNLLLETPILSPVDECEYVLHGVKEYNKTMSTVFKNGVFLGVLAGMAIAAAIVAVMEEIAGR